MVDNGPIIRNPKGSANNYTAASPAASLSAYSETFDFCDLDVFALEYQADCTGTPSAKIEMQQSSDNTNWYVPDNTADINSALADKNLHGVKLGPIPVRYMRLKVTELGGIITDLVVTFRLSVQKRFAA
jgi:hypothetical protein